MQIFNIKYILDKYSLLLLLSLFLIFWYLQAIQNRLYNDDAALYNLLLSKWEKGQLSVTLPKPLAPHPQLTQPGMGPMIPHISIQNPDSKILNGNHAAKVPGLNGGGAGGGDPDEGHLQETDPSLDRYLSHGRRHTLGAAHNNFMAEDMRRWVGDFPL